MIYEETLSQLASKLISPVIPAQIYNILLQLKFVTSYVPNSRNNEYSIKQKINKVNS